MGSGEEEKEEGGGGRHEWREEGEEEEEVWKGIETRKREKEDKRDRTVSQSPMSVCLSVFLSEIYCKIETRLKLRH